MDNQTKAILKYALILFVITAVSAALLASVNMLTEGKIAENTVRAENDALREVMSEAAEFESVDGEEILSLGEEGIQAVYAAKNDAGETIGFCVKTAHSGYGGEIVSVIGVDRGGFVTGVSIISHSETPGLGANLIKDSFKEQFVGKGEVNVVKAGAKDGEINAISGATISSKAMAGSVSTAVRAAKALGAGDNAGGVSQ